MSLASVAELWRPDIAQYALTAPDPKPLEIPGWECTPYEIQTRGVTWLYATPRAILGDVTGTGKTIHAIGLAAILLAKQEAKRIVICVVAGTEGQWQEEFAKLLPGARVVTNRRLDKAKRRAVYKADWDVLVSTYDLAWRDAPLIATIQPDLLWCDESTSFKNRETKTAEGLRTIAAYSKRVVCASATPIQNSLLDIFAQLEVLGLSGSPATLFGDEEQFKSRYCVIQTETIHVKGGRLRSKQRIVAYQNLEHFVATLGPYYLRRTEGSGDMPDVVAEDVFVPMNKDQRERYEQYAIGRVDGVEISPAGKATWLLQACNNLAIPEKDISLDSSGKVDWLMEALDERLVDEQGEPAKVVVFCRWLYGITALTNRLRDAGIGYGVIQGGMPGEEKDEVRKRFWDDPDCRVCIITTAGEMGLNLQCARYVICLDLMLNPSRMEQILGRIKRSGSKHRKVFMLRLVASDSIEAAVLRMLQVKQALADFVHGDASDLFKELSDAELTTLIRHGVKD